MERRNHIRGQRYHLTLNLLTFRVTYEGTILWDAVMGEQLALEQFEISLCITCRLIFAMKWVNHVVTHDGSLQHTHRSLLQVVRWGAQGNRPLREGSPKNGVQCLPLSHFDTVPFPGVTEAQGCNAP